MASVPGGRFPSLTMPSMLGVVLGAGAGRQEAGRRARRVEHPKSSRFRGCAVPHKRATLQDEQRVHSMSLQ